MEKGERGNEMANGNKKTVGMDDERMGGGGGRGEEKKMGKRECRKM